jgi:hypothetical protein
MVALRGTDIVRIPVAEAAKELKTVNPARYGPSTRPAPADRVAGVTAPGLPC